MTERNISSDARHGRAINSTGQPATPVPRSRRFRFLCAAVAGVAFLQMISQVENGWRDFLDLTQAYAAWSAVAVGLSMLFHAVANRVLVAEVRALSVKQFYLIWMYNRLWTLRNGDFGAALAALIVTSSSFTVYKSRAIGAHGYNYDDILVRLDRMLFGGADPWQLTHALFDTAQVTRLLEFLYHPAFMPMVLGYTLCIVIRSRPELRYTYVVSYLVSVVFIGMGLAHAMGSAGPLFDGSLFGDGRTFAPLVERLRHQSAESGPLLVLETRDYLEQYYHNQTVAIGTGISAMPSMHIVLAALWAFAALHLNRWLGVAATAYFALIWAASVHLGWHYFTDGLVGLAVVMVIWAGVGRVFGLYPSRRDRVVGEHGDDRRL